MAATGGASTIATCPKCGDTRLGANVLVIETREVFWDHGHPQYARGKVLDRVDAGLAGQQGGWHEASFTCFCGHEFNQPKMVPPCGGGCLLPVGHACGCDAGPGWTD